MKRALIDNTGIRNIVEHYERLKKICADASSRSKKRGAPRVGSNNANILILDSPGML